VLLSVVEFLEQVGQAMMLQLDQFRKDIVPEIVEKMVTPSDVDTVIRGRFDEVITTETTGE
jgi:hypothetical protein